MNFSFRVLLITFLCIFSIRVYTQVDTTSRANVIITVDRNDTLQQGKHLTIIPMVFYTPETEFGFGMGGQGTFYTKGSSKNTRPSSIFFSGIYTTRNQFMLMAEPKIYFNNESFLLEGKYEFKISQINFGD